MKVLMIDLGGTSVKLMATGERSARTFASGRGLTPARLVEGTLARVQTWDYEVISFGYPGIVRDGRVAQEPHYLAKAGWPSFDFEKAFECPVRIINDAAMQALSNYKSGRLLFVGLGTSVGATLIADDTVVPLEIGMIPISRSEVFFERLGKEGLRSQISASGAAVERAVRLLRGHLLAGSLSAWRRECQVP